MTKTQRRSLSKLRLAENKKKLKNKPSMAEQLQVSIEKLATEAKAKKTLATDPQKIAERETPKTFVRNTSEDNRFLGVELESTKPAKLTGQDLITHFEQISDASERNQFYTKNRNLLLKAYGLNKF